MTVTALDVVYALETADFFGEAFDHDAHRHPIGREDGCGCPSELVDSWLIHCAGNRIHYPDGVNVNRAWVNAEVTAAPRPARRALSFWLPALTMVGCAGLVLGFIVALYSFTAVLCVDAVGQGVRSRRRNRYRRVPAASVVRSGRLPGRYEMQVTMGAMSLVLDRRVAVIRGQFGADAATEFDREVTAALYGAAVTAAKIREVGMVMKTSGRYRPLPHHTLWVQTGGQKRLNQRVVRTADGAYFSAELTELADLYRTWVAQLTGVAALIGWDVRSGQLVDGEYACDPRTGS